MKIETYIEKCIESNIPLFEQHILRLKHDHYIDDETYLNVMSICQEAGHRINIPPLIKTLIKEGDISKLYMFCELYKPLPLITDLASKVGMPNIDYIIDYYNLYDNVLNNYRDIIPIKVYEAKNNTNKNNKLVIGSVIHNHLILLV